MFNMFFIYGIYIVGLVFQWLKDFSYVGKIGVVVIEQCNIDKVVLFYGVFDVFGFYDNCVVVNCCLCMNVLFYLCDECLNEVFLVGVKECGLL